ncbi:MAG: SDR family oxidoreductase [Candidatus Omnitrophica bacterium]|nr:SDR family oxidoreductase [Candidatus Omnitrophota bacterium]
MTVPESIQSLKLSHLEVDQCVKVLEFLLEDTTRLAELSNEQRLALLKAAGKISRPDKEEIRKRLSDLRRMERQKIVTQERQARATTGIRRAREASIFIAPEKNDTSVKESKNPHVSARNCYVCKADFTQLHHFYDQMCPTCAEFNYQKRFQTAPLDGQVALITGSRLKIGYQATMMMLRSGATVIATTRFPVDSALRFSKEKDYDQWKNRLHIYGLDLRHTPSVEIFCRYVEQNFDRLDLLINNAAQTVRRPPGFYAHLLALDLKSFHELPQEARTLLSRFEDCKRQILIGSTEGAVDQAALPVAWSTKTAGIGMLASARLSQIPYAYDHTLASDEVFPQGKLDADLQQVDLRTNNSWRLTLGEIPTAEMMEIQLVNAIAPFVLCNRLSGMMKRDDTGKKHIVNVSAMEGKFHRYKKSNRHPHTNMAKAALNMLTHTSAADLAKSGIFMNAVDTGWVTDEDPITLAKKRQEMHDFQPPLDIVDGAARVCDPFFNGILTGEHWCGKFLKDYYPIDW